MARSLNEDASQAVITKDDAVNESDIADLTKPKDVAVEDIAEERWVTASIFWYYFSHLTSVDGWP